MKDFYHKKSKIHQDSYFEMSTLYYFQLPILKDERNMGTKIPLMTKKDNFMHNAGLLIISKPEIHRNSYFEMSTLYYIQLLIQKDERHTICILQPSATYNIIP